SKDSSRVRSRAARPPIAWCSPAFRRAARWRCRRDRTMPSDWPARWPCRLTCRFLRTCRKPAQRIATCPSSWRTAITTRSFRSSMRCSRAICCARKATRSSGTNTRCRTRCAWKRSRISVRGCAGCSPDMRKYVVGASLLAVLAVAALAGYLYMQREQLLQRAIEHYGSEILGASVSVSSVRFAPGDGDGAIRGLRLGPPLGFDRDVATADAIELSIEPASITKDVVRVRRIALQAPAIVYEQRTSGTNLNALQRNVQHYLGDKIGRASCRERV